MNTFTSTLWKVTYKESMRRSETGHTYERYVLADSLVEALATLAAYHGNIEAQQNYVRYRTVVGVAKVSEDEIIVLIPKEDIP